MANIQLNKQSILPIEKIQRLVDLEAQEKMIKRQINIYRTELLVLTQNLDVLTLKTGKYTITRAKRITPKVLNFKVLKASLDAQDIPYETMETFTPQMMVMFREAIKQDRKLEGLDAMETEYIAIRVKNEGGEINE